MIKILAVSLAIAQLNVVTFDICYLDFESATEEFIPDPRGRKITIVVDQVVGFRHANPTNLAGIDCVLILTSRGRAYVVGTLREVCERLGIDVSNPGCRK